MASEFWKSVKKIDKLELRVVVIYFLISVLLSGAVNIGELFISLGGIPVIGIFFQEEFLNILFIFTLLAGIANLILYVFQVIRLRKYFKQLKALEIKDGILPGKSEYNEELFYQTKKNMASVIDFIIVALFALVILLALVYDDKAVGWIEIVTESSNKIFSIILIGTLLLILITFLCPFSTILKIEKHFKNDIKLVKDKIKHTQIEVVEKIPDLNVKLNKPATKEKECSFSLFTINRRDK